MTSYSIVDQLEEKRKRRAFAVAAAGLVKPEINGADPHGTHGTHYAVYSQTGTDRHYTVTDVQVTTDVMLAKCTCPDWTKHANNGFLCKHGMAAGIMRIAGRTCLQLAQDKQMPISEVLFNLENQRTTITNDEIGIKFDILIQAARLLARIAGGRSATDD